MKHLLWAGLLLVFGAHAIAAIALNATDVSAVVAFAHATWNCDGGSPPCESCAKRVPEGTLQSPYGCAPFVAHALAAGGFVPRPRCGSLNDFSGVAVGGLTYDLNVVSKFDPKCGSKRCLLDYLEATHWTPASSVTAGVVCAVTGTEGPYTHVVVGVGNNMCAAHNAAHNAVKCDAFWKLDQCVQPPAYRVSY